MTRFVGIVVAALFAIHLAFAEETTTTAQTVDASSTPPTIDSLRSRIEEKNKQIEDIEKEIAVFEQEIVKTGEEAKTLSNQVKATNAAISILSSDIRITTRRVEAAELRLEELEIAIGERGQEIANFKQTLGELMRATYERDSQTLLEILLAHASFSSFFTDVENVQSLGDSVERELNYLASVKASLADESAKRESERHSLVSLKRELSDRKMIEESARREKNTLLAATKSREAEFEAELHEREELRRTLEAEIYSIETELRKLIDPTALPEARSGVLVWPILGAVLTQSFGNTLDSKILYNGQPHNGIDIRARAGTPVLAAEDGEVWEVGDTDAFRRCLSYGKWILIRHPNHLSTLYAHLSLMKVAKGDIIKRGEVIGYSGYTGYTVPQGPAGAHLHLTVYDSSTVRFGPSRNARSTCEFLPFGGYLNPLAYLPR